MKKIYGASLAILTLLLVYGETSDLIRETQHGLVRGMIMSSAADPTFEFYGFKGVPYARPPVGSLRFEEPQRPDSWYDVKEATAPANRCTQISENFMGTEVIGSEDCLYLEIFEPITARQGNNEPLPVMVWIHGGTFIFGSANATGPDYFMEKPTVLVTVQYRLNVFGFLSTRDEYAKGNHGLKDQAFALRWIQDNIKNFGGDPNRVTIFGESAGGASVQYQMLSSKSKGLFHGAISQSGTPLNRWALQQHPRKMAFMLGRGIGISAADSKTLIEKLRKVDYRVLLKAAFNASVVGFYTPYYAQPFAPIVERKSDTAFISESPYNLLEKGSYVKVPYILGFNTEEGSFGYDYIHNGRVDIDIYTENPGLILPISMNIPDELECYKNALEQIQSFYFNNTSVTDKVNWINYMSQELFVRGIQKAMNFMYMQMPTYFYKFSYSGSRPASYLGGVGHFEEVQYLFYPRKPEWNPVESEADQLTRKRFVTLWTNFARTSNPTPEEDPLLQNIQWPGASPDKAFLNIGGNLTLETNSEHEHFEFWEKLFAECGYPPYTTY